MSQRGRKKRKNSDDEDEYDYSKSKKQKDSSIDKEELNKLVGDLMRYALFLDHNKTPLRRDDINKTILKEHKRASKQVISAAQQKFKDIFGMELIEVPKKLSGTSASKSGSGVYVLRNITDTKSLLHWNDQDAAEVSLLMVVLSMIWLNNGMVDQETLYGHLKRLGLQENEDHPVFENWERLLETKFTKEQYLDRKKGDTVGADGRILYEYRMGPRSLVEIDKKNLLQFIAMVHGEDRIDPALLRQLELEEEEANNREEEDSEPASQSQSQPQQQPKTTAKKSNGVAAKKAKKAIIEEEEEDDSEEDEDSESEEEPLQRRNKRKTAKDSESESDDEPAPPKKQTRRRR